MTNTNRSDHFLWTSRVGVVVTLVVAGISGIFIFREMMKPVDTASAMRTLCCANTLLEHCPNGASSPTPRCATPSTTTSPCPTPICLSTSMTCATVPITQPCELPGYFERKRIEAVLKQAYDLAEKRLEIKAKYLELKRKKDTSEIEHVTRLATLCGALEKARADVAGSQDALERRVTMARIEKHLLQQLTEIPAESIPEPSLDPSEGNPPQTSDAPKASEQVTPDDTALATYPPRLLGRVKALCALVVPTRPSKDEQQDATS